MPFTLIIHNILVTLLIFLVASFLLDHSRPKMSNRMRSAVLAREVQEEHAKRNRRELSIMRPKIVKTIKKRQSSVLAKEAQEAHQERVRRLSKAQKDEWDVVEAPIKPRPVGGRFDPVKTE